MKKKKKTKKKSCMRISDACATFPIYIYTRSPGIKLERRRRRRSWCGGSGGRGLSALPLHLHITWQLQLCWLSAGAFDSANAPRRRISEDGKRERRRKNRKGAEPFIIELRMIHSTTSKLYCRGAPKERIEREKKRK